MTWYIKIGTDSWPGGPVAVPAVPAIVLRAAAARTGG